MKHLLTGLVADPVVKTHDTGPDCPECVERYDAAFRGVCARGLIDHLEKIPCRLATTSEVEYAHAPRYVERAHDEIKSGASTLSTGDTEVCPASFDAALYAVGGSLNAVDAVVARRVKNAFCIVRPPGHHATGDRGMGFCVFNNIAIAARHAQRLHGLHRVAIVDWDVHHGNGTQDIFYEDGSVFYFSTHQSPWYPDTGMRNERGAGPGLGATLNCPVPSGAGRREIFAAFDNEFLPAMESFKPDLVLVSAGFDARRGDPLGELKLTDQDFADLTRRLLALAERHAGGRLVSILEGGYNLPGLASAVAAHVRTLAGLDEFG